MANLTRARLYELLDGDPHDGGWDRVACWAMLGLIALNVGALMLDTSPKLHVTWGRHLDRFQAASGALFVLEYVLRAWSAPNRWRHLASFNAMLDLVVALSFVVPAAGGPAWLSGFRMLALFKLWRYTTSNDMLWRIIKARRSDLVSSLALLGMVILMASTAMYYAEHVAQPDKFFSITASMWWAVVTLTTVGYGDVYPITTLGKALAGIIAISGIGTFALPTAILGSAFLDELMAARKGTNAD